jgi:mannose-6-phosphate isomerase-like protein (cupin superfamily)
VRTTQVGLCGIVVIALCGVASFGQGQGGGQRAATQAAPQGADQHPAAPGLANTTPPKDRGAYFTASDFDGWYASQAAGKIRDTTWLLYSEPYELEVRRVDKPQTILVHCCKADLWIVRSGEGTFTTGRDLIEGKSTGGEHAGMTAKAIRNGVSRVVKAGDVVVVPPGVAHGFTEIKMPIEALFLGYEVPHEESHTK